MSLELPSTFNRNASLYEKVRPGYPAQLIDQIFEFGALGENSDILEIGSGTGKATECLADRCRTITCVEPGNELVAVLKSKFQTRSNVTIINSTFEEFESAGRYAAVVAAQTAHWINPESRLSKPAELLQPGGTLAFIWNASPKMHTPFFRDLYAIWDQLAAGIREPSHSTEIEGKVSNAVGEEILVSPLFENASVVRVPWTAYYTPEEFSGLVRTFSNHQIMPPDLRDAVFAEIDALCLSQPNLIEKRYVAIAYLGRTPPGHGT